MGKAKNFAPPDFFLFNLMTETIKKLDYKFAKFITRYMRQPKNIYTSIIVKPEPPPWDHLLHPRQQNK